MRALAILIGTFLCLSILWGCSNQRPSEPQMILPNPPEFSHKDRNYGLTESPDGKLRVFTAERGDPVNLMVMTKTETGWSEPRPLDLPKRRSVGTAMFSKLDGRLYYSSDYPAPNRNEPRNTNFWSVELDGNGDIVGEPVFYDYVINRVSQERSLNFAKDGTIYYTSTNAEGEGSFDIYTAKKDAEGDWQVDALPGNTYMGESDLVLSPDGKYLFFYAHIPKAFGVVDIFYMEKTKEGWSDRKNMGPFINTSGIDYGPGFSADGKTFFFSRNGQMFEVDYKTAMKEAKKYNRSLEKEANAAKAAKDSAE